MNGNMSVYSLRRAVSLFVVDVTFLLYTKYLPVDSLTLRRPIVEYDKKVTRGFSTGIFGIIAIYINIRGGPH